MQKSEIIEFNFNFKDKLYVDYFSFHSVMPAWQTYNALFTIRCILKYLIETVGEDEMVRHTEAQQSGLNSNSMLPVILTSFFEALVEVIVDIPLW